MPFASPVEMEAAEVNVFDLITALTPTERSPGAGAWAHVLSRCLGARFVPLPGRRFCPAAWAQVLSRCLGAGFVPTPGRTFCPAAWSAPAPTT